MKIKVDNQMKIALLKAIKTGELDTMDIPALYGQKYDAFMELMQQATARDENKSK